MIFGWGTVVKAAVVIGAALAVYLAWQHYEGLLKEREVLTAENVILRKSVDDWKDAVSKERENAVRFQMDLEKMTARYDEARGETERLQKLFAKHDLRRLSDAKPGLVQNRINRGTRAAVRMLNEASRVDGDGGPSSTDPASSAPSETPAR